MYKNNFNWSLYNGNLTWLQTNTIFLTRYGSHAYGTAIVTSDEDFRGICVPPKEYYLSFFKNFEQAESKDPDLTVFDIKKFFKLAVDNNPNVLELLFIDPSDYLITTPYGDLLIKHRNKFLSKKCRYTMSGYAHAQMKRILTHRKWLMNPQENKPLRSDFGLTENLQIPKNQLEASFASITKRIESWLLNELEDLDPATKQCVKNEFISKLLELTKWGIEEQKDKTFVAAAKSLGYETNFIEYIDKEHRYNQKLREWKQYQEWKINRNKVRSEMEAKYSMDTKHCMHIVRLMRSCKELLSTGQLLVRRPDAAELLSIRNGAWTFEQLYSWFEQQDAEINELMAKSVLPHKPDSKFLEQLCQQIVEDFYKKL